MKRVVFPLALLLLTLFSCDLLSGNWDYILRGAGVNGICEDGDVFWVATDAGLVKLNRVSGYLEKLHRGNTPLPSNEITGVTLGWDGALWVGTGRGLVSKKGDDWRVWTPVEMDYQSDEYMVDAIHCDKNGSVWVAIGTTSFEGERYGSSDLRVISPQGVETLGFRGEFNLLGAYSSLMYASMWGYTLDELAANEAQELQEFQVGDVKLYLLESTLADESSATIDPAGNVWYLDSYEIVRQQVVVGSALGRKEIFTSPCEQTQAICCDTEGNIYCLGDGKLYRKADQNWDALPVQLLESDRYYYHLFGLLEGRIAVTCVDSLIEMDHGKNRNYNINPTTVSSAGYGFALDPKQGVWIASGKELSYFDGKSWSKFDYPFEIDPYDWDGNATIVFDKNITPWLAINNTVYRLQDNNLVLEFQTEDLLKIMFDQQDNLWALCQDKLFCLSEGSWRQISAQDSKIPLQSLHDVCIDSHGNIWILTEGFVFNYTQGTKLPLTMNYGSNGHYPVLLVDEDNTIWIGNDCLYSFRKGKWTKLSDYGFIAIDKAQHDTVWGFGREHQFGVSIFTYKNNQVSEFSPYPNPHFTEMFDVTSIKIDRYNNKWFLTDSGLAIYNEDGVNVEFSR